MTEAQRFSKVFDIKCNSSISSAVLTDNHVFVGLIGEDSNVNVYNYKKLGDTHENISPNYILENSHGGISKLALSPCKELLLGVTCYGWIYIWNIETLNDHKMNIDDQSNNIHKHPMIIKPKIHFSNNHSGDSVCVDFINSNIIIAAGINPGSSISFISVQTGKLIGQYISKKNELSGLAWPIYYQIEDKENKDQSLELAIYSFTNIAIERSSSSGGYWVALGGSNGFVTVMYFPYTTIAKIEKLVNNDDIEDEETNLSNSDFLWKCHQISELSTEIRSLSWRPRSNNVSGLCLVCGICDSLLRYCFIETENKNIIFKKINLVKITDGIFSSSEINSISFPKDNSSILVVAFNRFSSSKKHPIFVKSGNLLKKSQSLSSFRVYIQDIITRTNEKDINKAADNCNNSFQTYFYCIANHSDIVTCVSTSPCGKFIVSSSIDGTLHIYSKDKVFG